MNSGKQNKDPEQWLPPLVVLAGVGMGRDDLSLGALRWINRAEVLAGGKRQVKLFPEHTGEELILRSSLEAFLKDVDEISRHKRTAVLASGDPLFFGIGRRLVNALGSERVLTLPNVTTVQTLFARLGRCWDDAKVISLHGRGESPPSSWLGELRGGWPVAVFTDKRHTPAWIARELLDASVSDRVLVVGEDLGLPTERIRRMTPEEAGKATFSPLNLVAILPEGLQEPKAGAVQSPPSSVEEGEQCPAPVLGLAEEAFQHQAGLITKLEVRAVVLACLQLSPDHVLWDLGAGSGSVSIEAVRMASLKRVFAIERNPRRFSDLLENIRRFRCFEIHPICGLASEELNKLPDPDRVFIGGGGEDLEAVLQQVERRLRPGGRVVQTVVTFDTLQAAVSFWKDKPFDLNITHLQVSRSAPIGESLRLEPLNPVFVVCVGQIC